MVRVKDDISFESCATCKHGYFDVLKNNGMCALTKEETNINLYAVVCDDWKSM